MSTIHRVLLAAAGVALLASTPLLYAAADPGRPHVLAIGEQASTSAQERITPASLPGGYRNVVVVYQDGASFDHLFGTWGRVGDRVADGVEHAVTHLKPQRDQHGRPYPCLPQVDVNLAEEASRRPCGQPVAAFPNAPFPLDELLPPTARTCPEPGTNAPHGLAPTAPGAQVGGCTASASHRFYQDKYAIHGGMNDRFVSGSPLSGTALGYRDSTLLPLYQYLHRPDAPHYVVTDRVFQAAFGSSFLNYQFQVAGRPPLDPLRGHGEAANSVVDAAEMPGATASYVPTRRTLVDGALTVTCPDGGDHLDRGCGHFAVNPLQPASSPRRQGPTLPTLDSTRFPTIGDRLTERGVTWNWYSGGWAAALTGAFDPRFRPAHQPLNYFTNYAQGGTGRSHLRDESEFLAAAKAGTLPQVSFVQPLSHGRRHPAAPAVGSGGHHLVDVVDAVLTGPQAQETLVIVTSLDHDGRWDHVAPPAHGSPTPGVFDAWGPGVRVPLLLTSRAMTSSGVSSTVYDTTSILATLNAAFGLAPLGSRDAAVAPLDAAIVTGHRPSPTTNGRPQT